MNSAHLYSFQTIQAQNICFAVYANSFIKLICSFVSSNLVPKHDAKIEAHQIPLRFRSSLTIAFLQFLIFYDLTYKCLNKTVHKWHIIILCRGIHIKSKASNLMCKQNFWLILIIHYITYENYISVIIFHTQVDILVDLNLNSYKKIKN